MFMDSQTVSNHQLASYKFTQYYPLVGVLNVYDTTQAGLIVSLLCGPDT